MDTKLTKRFLIIITCLGVLLLLAICWRFDTADYSANQVTIPFDHNEDNSEDNKDFTVNAWCTIPQEFIEMHTVGSDETFFKPVEGKPVSISDMYGTTTWLIEQLNPMLGKTDMKFIRVVDSLFYVELSREDRMLSLILNEHVCGAVELPEMTLEGMGSVEPKVSYLSLFSGPGNFSNAKTALPVMGLVFKLEARSDGIRPFEINIIGKTNPIEELRKKATDEIIVIEVNDAVFEALAFTLYPKKSYLVIRNN